MQPTRKRRGCLGVVRLENKYAYDLDKAKQVVETEMTALRKQTEKEFPALGYYAMDQSEMFYQDDRTYTLECIKFDGGIRLRQEYSDDKLAK